MGRARKRKQDRGDASPEASEKPAKGAHQRAQWRPRPSSPAVPLGLLAVLAVGAVAYANSFSVPFLFDDHFAIVGNPEIRSIEPVGRFFTQSRGLPHLLDVLNYRWGGEQVWGYHLVNVAVHLVNAMLVFALTLLTLRLPVHGGRYDSRAPVLAAVVAMVFVAHPLQTMAVSYIVQRAESVSAMFYLLAVLLFAAGQSGRIALRGAALGAGLLVLGFLGILSKETVASLPAALLLYYVCFLRDGQERSGVDWRLALLLVVPLLYGVYLARHFLLPGFGDEDGQSSWMYIPSAGLGIEGVTPGRYLITQFGVILWYLRLLVLPIGLTFDYGWPFADSLWSFEVLAPLAVLLAMIAVAVATYSSYRWVAFAVGWLFITLAPSSSIIPIKDAAFEYRMYLPMLGFVTLAVVGVSDLAQRLSTGSAAGRSAQRLALGVGLLWVSGLVAATIARNQTLQDPMALAVDSVQKAPDHWRNQFGLGAALLEAGNKAEAVAPFERAIALNPEQSTARIMLADLYSREGRLEEAEEILLPATDAREESVAAAAYRQLGYIYKGQGYPEAAITMFEEALVRQRKWRSLDLQIARLLRHDGRYHDAAVRMNRLVREVPSYGERYRVEVAQINLLGGVHSFEEGEPDFTLHMLGIAMGDAKTVPLATHYLAFTHASLGNRAEAIHLLSDLERRGLADASALANLDRARAGEDLVVPATSRQLARQK